MKGLIFNCVSLYIIGYKYIVFMVFSTIQFLFIANLSHIHRECNYRTRDPITRFLAMTLDIQIEHHLFPNIPTSSLRKIQHIVRDFCLKNDIPYIEKPSMFHAVCSYVRYLRKMGNP
jgi:linoleoyl-CoA desaturase